MKTKELLARCALYVEGETSPGGFGEDRIEGEREQRALLGELGNAGVDLSRFAKPSYLDRSDVQEWMASHGN